MTSILPWLLEESSVAKAKKWALPRKMYLKKRLPSHT